MPGPRRQPARSRTPDRARRAFASITVLGARRAVSRLRGPFPRHGSARTYEVRPFLGYSPSPVQAACHRRAHRALDFALQEIGVQQVKASGHGQRRLSRSCRADRAQRDRGESATSGADHRRRAPAAGRHQRGEHQIHVAAAAPTRRFLVNGVANRDLVTGQSTAGQLNARSVAEVNVATGAYDVRYGNALSGIVEVSLKDGGERLEGGFTTAAGSYGGRSLQFVVGGPDPVVKPLLGLMRVKLPGTMSAILDVSGAALETRFPSIDDVPGNRRLVSGYEDSFLGHRFSYGDFFAPSQDNRWSARYGLTWRPGSRDKWNYNFSKRIEIDQGFSRTFIRPPATPATGLPLAWSKRIEHAPTIFEDNPRCRSSATDALDDRFTCSSCRATSSRSTATCSQALSQYDQPDDSALPRHHHQCRPGRGRRRRHPDLSAGCPSRRFFFDTATARLQTAAR